MASKLYFRTTLTGGTSGALDGIDGAILAQGDGAIVITDGWAYYYHLNAASGVAESSPDFITPDLNPGDKRWEIVNIAEYEPILDDRRFFVQSAEPADADSEEGDIWIDIS